MNIWGSLDRADVWVELRKEAFMDKVLYYLDHFTLGCVIVGVLTLWIIMLTIQLAGISWKIKEAEKEIYDKMKITKPSLTLKKAVNAINHSEGTEKPFEILPRKTLTNQKRLLIL